MRKLLQPANISDIGQVNAAFSEIFRASQENDTVDIASAFTISGTYTQTRTLNVSAPTVANIAAVLATLIDDLRRGGSSKTT